MLDDILRAAEAGRFPPADGGVTVVPQRSPREAAVLAFTAHHVVVADIDPSWVRDQLPHGDLSAAGRRARPLPQRDPLE